MTDAVAKIIVVTDTAQAEAGMKKFSDSAAKSAEQVSKGFKIAGAALTAAGAAGVAAIKGLTGAFFEQERAEAKLEQILGEVVGASDEQVESLKDLAAQMQQFGVIGDEVTIAGQAQLATFNLQTETIATLSGGMLDLVANTKGVNATQEDAVNIANLFGKVMTGQASALTRYGVTLTDAQTELIKFGTEQERANVLAEALNSNFGGVNAALAKTAEGGLQQAINNFGDFKEQLGEQMIPILTDLLSVVNKMIQFFLGLSDETKRAIAIFILAGTAFATVVGPLLLIIGFLPTIIAGFAALGAAAAAAWIAVTGPVALVVVGIAAVVAMGVVLVKNWESIKEGAVIVFTAIGNFLIGTFNAIMEGIKSFINTSLGAFKSFWDAVKLVFEFALDAIAFLTIGFFVTYIELWITTLTILKEFLIILWEGIKALFSVSLDFIAKFSKKTWTAIKTDITNVWEGIKAVVAGGFQAILDTINFFIAPIKEAFSALWSGASGVITNGVDVLISVIKGMLNTIISFVNKAISGLNTVIQGANKVPGVTIPTIPNIPALADGGIVTKPTLALIGEAGPEAVIPLGKKAGAFGGGGNTFIFEGPVSSQEGVMEMLQLAVQELQLSDKVV